jgi:phage-related protein
MVPPDQRPVRWVASSRDDLRAFPARVRQVTGTALFFAQTGSKHPSAKPLKGIIRGSGVLEVVADHTATTYRTVYTVTFPEAIYVLHAFQKKSKRGIATPKHEIDLIRSRYEQARLDYEHEFGSGKDR